MKHLRILVLCAMGLALLVFAPRPTYGETAGPINLTILEAAGDGSRLVVNGVVTVEGATITRINWDWGDGLSNDSFFPASHVYTSDGAYTVTVTAFDSLGRTASQTINVEIPLTPIPITLALGDPVISGFDVTIGGVVLGGGGIITRLNWNWGDGTSTDSFGPNFFPSHTYQTEGTFLVTVTAFDDLGRTVMKTATVEIQLTVAPVDIDIKPGGDPNSINLRSRGVIPVAVLSSETFDATTLDPSSIVFEGANVAFYNFDDINSDGLVDKIVHFRTQEITDLTKGDTEACLEAFTFDGIPVLGCDSVRLVDGMG